MADILIHAAKHPIHMQINRKTIIYFILLVLSTQGVCQVKPLAQHTYLLSSHDLPARIFVSNHEKDVVKISAQALCEDIADITGNKPQIVQENELAQANVIIGTINDSLINRLLTRFYIPDISKQWEHFVIQIVKNPFNAKQDVLLIIGSDPRGTAYGIFTVSRWIGISPWKWWADALPAHRDTICLPQNLHVVDGPSVKYRGIFINDEDWGFRPWAARNMDTALGNIGPSTYARVFELLLRLRANTIWPAMHPGTRAFFTVKGNAETAQKYDIIIGTSHAEPMLRNNVGEWHVKQMGDYNYITNRNAVYHYWEQRVKEVAHTHNVIFTLGMRGIHDSKMEGARTIEEQRQVLTQVFADQRSLLQKYIDKELLRIPQIFIPYKEVLPVYDHGLKVPDDVTLVWPDDNYGYIRRLSDATEQKRIGSSGVYYHISYWGKPHDYLWLCTTQPGLIWEEMQKAWAYGANRIWILNVGDIKPGEFDIQLFLDMAWDIHSIHADQIKLYMQQWYANIFGNALAHQITAIMDEYYRLATIRKPEFMGWNQIEPITPVHNSAFDPFQHGDEIYKRIKAYRRLIQQVEQIKAFIPERLYDAYVELVSYPVQASAYMNEKMLYAQKSRLFATYHLPVALKYASLSRQAYDSIISLTAQYNHLAHGKWMNMMDMKPRNLPVFQQADLPEQVDSFQKGILVWLEGQNAPMTNYAHDTLPCFSGLPHESHFIELFNQDTTPVYWHASANVKWIQLSQTSGFLNEEERITVQIVRNYLPSDSATGSITIQSGDSSYMIDVKATIIADSVIPASILIEKNTCVAIQGYQYTSKHETSNGARWTSIPLLGYSDSACMLLPASAYPINQNDTSYLSYRFYTQSTGPARITIFTLPTHAVQPNTSLRIAVMLDHGDKHVLSYEAPAEIAVWRENVLSNHARCMFSTHFSRPGWHELKIAPLDPGVIIDQILVSFQPAIPVYAIQSKLTK